MRLRLFVHAEVLPSELRTEAARTARLGIPD